MKRSVEVAMRARAPIRRRELERGAAEEVEEG
jgi:hypothetical protein